MEVYLIRHTTPAIVPGTVYGHLDVQLADLFETEREEVLRRLPLPVKHVYSSPSTRCTRLAHCLSPDVAYDERLREVCFGMWEGRRWDSIPREELNPWMNDFVHACPPGGESLLQMNERVLLFWQELQQKNLEKVAVVTHAGVIRIIMACINGIPLSSMFELKVEYGQVFEVRI